MLHQLLGLSLLFAQSQNPEPAAKKDYDVPPKLLKQKKPKFPQPAFGNQLEGLVVVEFVIDEEGKVQDPRVIRSAPDFDAAAIEAVLQWKFAPARKDGKAVRTVAQAPVSFCIYRDGCRAGKGPGQSRVR